ncbi:DUF983 domain-containing protein [Phenylobacterium sp.]|jgi:uncharacterized protein (DUF983 family)|uniref:DUF983 domain-containing protein n=1 Tax=Phenylobacterium sp. TaxID=1871053 RepID=UPI002F428BDC
MTAMSEFRRPFLASMLRGLRGKCPACGTGPLYWAYLKVEPNCHACGHDLARYPADDGPAYFTILLVGHLVIVPVLFLPFIWQAPAALAIPITVIPLAAITLALLPRVKGAFIGLLYALNVKDTDAHLHTADAVK